MNYKQNVPRIGGQMSPKDEERMELQAVSQLWERRAQLLEKVAKTCMPALSEDGYPVEKLNVVIARLEEAQACYLRSAEYTKKLIDSFELDL